MTFFTSRAFWILQCGSIVQNLGFFIPSVYIPAYAQSIGLSSVNGTTALSFINAATVLGAITLGALVDRYHVTTVMFISAAGSGLAVLVFWGLGLSQAMLYIFAMLYGIFAGGSSATFSGFTNAVRQSMRRNGDENAGIGIEAGMLLSFVAAGKGIGAVVSGPLSSRLLRSGAWESQAAGAYGTCYGLIIIFSRSYFLKYLFIWSFSSQNFSRSMCNHGMHSVVHT